VTAGCNVCGAGDERYRIAYPTGGHADWCERVTAWLAEENRHPMALPLSEWPEGVVPNGGRCGVAGCERIYAGPRHVRHALQALASIAARPKEDSVSTDTDAIRTILADDLIAARAENDALRADLDDLRRTLIRERAARKAEADRARSGRRWLLP
jgi:hypothetical protein